MIERSWLEGALASLRACVSYANATVTPSEMRRITTTIFYVLADGSHIVYLSSENVKRDRGAIKRAYGDEGPLTSHLKSF